MSQATISRRATNVTLPESLIAQAKELKINVSQACEAGLAAQVKAARAAKWLEENREAVDSFNSYIEKHGIALKEHRMF